MPKINTKSVFKNLAGEVLKSEDGKELTLGEALSNIVLTHHKDKAGFRPLKAYELAKRLYNDAEVDLDQSDLIQIKEILENNESYVTIVTAQALQYLEAAK